MGIYIFTGCVIYFFAGCVFGVWFSTIEDYDTAQRGHVLVYVLTWPFIILALSVWVWLERNKG